VLRAAARMRPDRWIVGALSGRMGASTLEAVSEGAEGVLASASAPTLRQGLSRLVTQLLLAQPGLSPEAARECVAESFDIAVEVHLLPEGRYRVTRIAELGGTDAKGLVVRDVFVATDGGEGHIATGVVPRIINEFAARGVRVDTNLFKKPGR
jgi:pilus assembly protein CpaF